MNLLDPLFRAQAVEKVFSNRATLQAMLDFEAALARAAASAGNLAIPLIKQLTLLVAQKDKESARYIHWGATSQNAIDLGVADQFIDRVLAVSPRGSEQKKSRPR